MPDTSGDDPATDILRKAKTVVTALSALIKGVGLTTLCLEWHGRDATILLETTRLNLCPNDTLRSREVFCEILRCRNQISE